MGLAMQMHAKTLCGQLMPCSNGQQHQISSTIMIVSGKAYIYSTYLAYR
jgi:hypothetical protein